MTGGDDSGRGEARDDANRHRDDANRHRDDANRHRDGHSGGTRGGKSGTARGDSAGGIGDDSARGPPGAGDASWRGDTQGRRAAERPNGRAGGGRGGSGDRGSSGATGPVGWVKRFWHTEHAGLVFIREALSSIAIVLLVGLLLFGVSGVWPPMVAVESSSMHPNMKIGDLVFVMDEDRFAPEAAQPGTGVVTYRVGQETGYTKFDRPGDVIVYEPNGLTRRTQIIHRAMFWVDAGENWYDEASTSAISGADNCRELANCPAPNAGFITKGDNNAEYDQVSSICGTPCKPIKPSWIAGTAEFRIPKLGCIKLITTGQIGAACFFL